MTRRSSFVEWFFSLWFGFRRILRLYVNAGSIRSGVHTRGVQKRFVEVWVELSR